ncbi:hypothetical protein SETIT_5G181000v2, partial [Setaria italica]
MNAENMLIWNVRGLNARARQNVVRQLVTQEHISLITLQETKLDTYNDSMIRELLGIDFDYYDFPASYTCGGVLLAWNKEAWAVSNSLFCENTLTAKVKLLPNGENWWLTCVYGPQSDGDKLRFLAELRDIRAGCSGTWMVCGDFNLIYKAEDKNNSRLD